MTWGGPEKLSDYPPVGGPAPLEADGKSPGARHPKSRGMRRTYKYAAVTRDEDNTADGGFPTASTVQAMNQSTVTVPE